jgi:demethylmenaquinone methyltransferase/2-methoxy-6-polyprenyl-1,4-benzoquinol methylase
MLLDNRFVGGSSTPISRTDDYGNSYQMRWLDSEAAYEVMKSFPHESELERSLAGHADAICLVELDYY